MTVDQKYKTLKVGSSEMYFCQGDCIHILPRLKKIISEPPKLILVDPPYGTTQCKWDVIIPFGDMWREINKIKYDNHTPTLIFNTEPFGSMLRVSNIKQYKYEWYWNKMQKSNFLNAKKQPLRSIETIAVFYEKPCLYNPQFTHGHERKTVKNIKRKTIDTYNDQYGCHNYDSTSRYPHNLLTFKKDTQKLSYHRTQKPVSLLEYLIRTYTKEGDTVLDFCMGSGSTGVACVNTGRNFIGIEKSQKYYDIAINRALNEVTEQEKIREL